MASTYSGGVKTLVSLLIKTGIEIKSYRTLSEAVEKAQKPLSQIIVLIKDDLQVLKKINKNLRIMGKGYLMKSVDADLLEYNQANDLRAEWWEKLSMPSEEINALVMVNKYDDILNNIESKIQKSEEPFAKFMKKSDDLNVLLRSTEKALNSWKMANDGLVLALKNNQQPNFTLFVMRAREIKNEVDKLKY